MISEDLPHFYMSIEDYMIVNITCEFSGKDKLTRYDDDDDDDVVVLLAPSSQQGQLSEVKWLG